MLNLNMQMAVSSNSQCRHIPKTMSRVDELMVGTKGKFFAMQEPSSMLKEKLFTNIHSIRMGEKPYQTEHDELFAAVAKGEYKFDNAEYGAHSTMTSILGRMATYSGQVIEWDKAINSGIDLHPKTYMRGMRCRQYCQMQMVIILWQFPG